MYTFKMTKEEALNIDLNEAFSLFESTCDAIKLSVGVAVSTLFSGSSDVSTPQYDDNGKIKLSKKDIEKMEELSRLRRQKQNG